MDLFSFKGLQDITPPERGCLKAVQNTNERQPHTLLNIHAQQVADTVQYVKVNLPPVRQRN